MSDGNNGRFGVALFGMGRIGQVHFRHMIINPRVEVRWIVEADATRARDVITRHHLPVDIKVVILGDEKQALEDPRVDLVVICTPSLSHEAIVKAALQAKKAVFCEKPLALSLEASRACLDLAESVGKPLLCAFNRRWDPQLREIKRRVAAGDVGQLRVVKTVSRDPPGMVSADYIRESGGVFIDSAVHDLDLLCWLAGEKPKTVYASGHATHDIYRECGDLDSCVAVLHFPCGVLGVVEVSREASEGYFQRVEVFGTKGMIQSGNHRALNLTTHTMSAVSQEPIVTDCTVRYLESYKAEMEHFLDVLEGQATMEVTKESVMTANQLAKICKQSVKTNSAINFS